MDDGDLEARVAELEARIEELAQGSDLDIAWMIISAILVFFMQVGFAMLEVGSVHPKNTKAVLIKNIGDASLGALCWWLVGFSLAYGEDKGGFVGVNLFALKGDGPYLKDGMKEAKWMFDWAFAATSVTIVSGAVAERVKIAAYVAYAIVLTAFIYPLVVHWTWHPDGWASPYREKGDGMRLLAGCGAADFAGSGVVHMVGGLSALVAAVAVKPRLGRFRNGAVCRLPQQSPALQTLGTLILWVGWYSFNAGSSITVSAGRSEVAARAVVATTIAPSAAVAAMVLSLKIIEKKFDTRGVNNGILAGLVAITAAAPLVAPEGAFIIGVVSAGIYYCSASMLLKLKIDDVVDAAPVHLFCGAWGLVASGLFATREGWDVTYRKAGGDRADECCGLFYGCGFNLLFANLALIASILAWVGVTSTILFYTIEVTVGLRVPISEEEHGMEMARKNSFLSTGKQGSIGGSSQKGMDAVRRAIVKAHLGVDESFYAGSISRSQQSSRAGSINSKNGDLSAATVEAVSNWKHEIAWGGTHTYNPRVERRIGPTAQVFGRPQRKGTVGPMVAQNRSKAETATEGANAVTPCLDRGPWVGFNGHSVPVGSRGIIAEYGLSSTAGQPEEEGKRPNDGDTVHRREEEKIERTPPLSDSVVLDGTV